MESEDKFYKMSYQELADFAVMQGLNVPYTAILELVNRGPDKADYLLRYIQERYGNISYQRSLLLTPASIPIEINGMTLKLNESDTQ